MISVTSILLACVLAITAGAFVDQHSYGGATACGLLSLISARWAKEMLE